MENASRALLMAASVLIGILILSLAVYLFVTFGASSAEVHKQIEVDKLNEFNTQFTIYDCKKVNIYDIITIANIATDNNIYYEMPKKVAATDGKDYYISVIFKELDDLGIHKSIYIEKGYNNNNNVVDYNEMISKSLENVDGSDTKKALKQYKCEVDISETTHRVYKITFTNI